MPDRQLDSLSPRFKPLAMEFLARCVEANVPVMIINTRRTPAEHAANLAAGVSWTTHSKHLDGDAIDICPYSQYELHGSRKLDWNDRDPVWLKLGIIGEKVGLRWGGRWMRTPDLGHFEYIEHTPTTVVA